MAQLMCNRLILGYGNQPVSKDISFEINQGDYFCIVGENGAGKSTLVKTLLGLTAPLGGSIQFGDGVKQTDIGYLPQQTAYQRDFPASVEEVVRSGGLNRMGLRPFYSREEKETAARTMEELGILHLRKKCYREISGGQQQRVLLCRALVATRKLLLLDEPVSGLDPSASAELYQLIRRLNKDHGITVIMISHDVDVASQDATHVLHMGFTPLFLGTAAGYRQSDVGKLFLRQGEGKN